MKLFFMRHGEAEGFARTDAERELTPKGREDCQQAVDAMAKRIERPDLLLVSPYRRAQQTTAIVQDGFSLSIPTERCDLVVPEGDPAAALRYLDTRSEDSIIVVTHNPFVTNVLHMLCQDQQHIRMTTSAIAEVNADTLCLGCGDLVWHYSLP